MSKARLRLPVAQEGEEICLGVVVMADHQKKSETIEALKQFPAFELGDPQGNRLPGCIVTPRGTDRDLIRAIEALPSVLKVEVAFAQVLETEHVEEEVS